MNPKFVATTQCYSEVRQVFEKQRKKTNDKCTVEGSQRIYTKQKPTPEVAREDALRAKPHVQEVSEYKNHLSTSLLFF